MQVRMNNMKEKYDDEKVLGNNKTKKERKNKNEVRINSPPPEIEKKSE